MAYSTLASGVNWTTGSPTIKFTFAYERQRSGADMKYRFRTHVSKVTSPSYFSNSIIQKTTLNGIVVNTRTIKDSGDSTWNAFNEYFPSSSGWYTVSGKTSGTVKVSFKMYSNGSRNVTYTYTLAVDPAASTITVADFTIDNSLSITPVVVKYDDSFTDNITVNLGTTTIATFNNYTIGDTLVFTNEQLNTIYSLMPSNAMKFKFTIETYSGNTSIGSNAASPTGTLINANPILTTASFTYKDSSTLTSLTGNNQTIVGGYSNLTLTADTGSNAPQPQKGATLTSYIINQSTFNYTTPFTTTINNYSSNNVEIVAEDNRGNSTNINLPINYLAYTPLSVTEATSKREDYVGDTVTFSFSGKMWIGSFGTVNNSIVSAFYTIQKENGTPVQGTTAINITVDSSGNFSFNGVLAGDDNGAFMVDSNYTVTIYLADALNNALGTTFPIILKIYAGFPAIKLNKNKITSLNFDENMTTPSPLPLIAGGTGASTRENALTNILGNSIIPDKNLPSSDYVIEIGTSGIWVYRKWNSGKAECWGQTSFSPSKATTMTYKTLTLPFPFYSVYPFCSTRSMAQINVFNFGCAPYETNNDGAYTSIRIGLYASNTTERHFNVFVLGSWK